MIINACLIKGVYVYLCVDVDVDGDVDGVYIG